MPYAETAARYGRHTGITAEEIAERVQRSVRSVRRRAGLDEYAVGEIVGTGRPATLYDVRCLELWATGQQQQPDPFTTRKGRNDVGLPRKCSLEQWERIVTRVKGLYLNSAQGNLRLACEQAVMQLAAEGNPVEFDLYKRLSRRGVNRRGECHSPVYAENWEVLRASIWRKKDLAISMPTLRYNYAELFESAGWAGEGFGALRVWSMDVRINDIWAQQQGGDIEMPSAIYIRCGLTGYPLWIEPILTEASTDIIRAYLSCGMAWGAFPDLGVAMDNGRAMISERTLNAIRLTLPETAFQNARNHPQVFHNGSPIMQNLPNIPQAMFKAGLERSFRLIKDEFDATRYPGLYQGGNRSEAVQLNLRAMPVYPERMLQAGEYYQGLVQWLWGDYVRRPRPRVLGLQLLAQRGITPSLESAFRYYGGGVRDGQMPDGERLALLLYWTTERPHRVIAQMGYCDATIDGRYNRWICPELDHRHYGNRVVVLPIPGDPDTAVILRPHDRRVQESSPELIGMATTGVVRHIAQLAEQRRASQQAGRTVRNSLRAARQVAPAAYRNATEPGALPNTGGGNANGRNAGERYIPPATAPPELPAYTDDELPTITTETADYLRDIQALLDDADNLLHT